jgi:hypothetical protein
MKTIFVRENILKICKKLKASTEDVEVFECQNVHITLYAIIFPFYPFDTLLSHIPTGARQ